jgi:hypothetical protein
VTRDEAEQVVALLRERRVFAHVKPVGLDRAGVRVVLGDGREALWDVDGAAGLEAMVMRDGVLVGFVPRIEGSASFTPQQCADAIGSADYGRP